MVQDFDEFWTTLKDRYCFFGEKQTDWDQVRRVYRPQAMAASSREALTAVLAEAAAELYDPHTSVSGLPPGTPRGAISDTLVSFDAGNAKVIAVQSGGTAEVQGLVPGDVIEAVNGRSVAALEQALAPKCLAGPDAAALAFAAARAVSGTRGEVRRYRVRRDGGRRVELVMQAGPPVSRPDVEWRRLEDGIGLIIIRSFADNAVIDHFNVALNKLRNYPGLILDVRGKGGDDTAVARPIMGRFIRTAAPYAQMRRREGHGLSSPWIESVNPVGPFTYEGPVVVLVDHWSGSMAEGFPMGMRSLGRARIVGTPMMGLGAAVFSIRLDRTGIEGQYSAEPVYDAFGEPRWRLKPDVEIAEGNDPLVAAQREIEQQRS